MSNLSSRIQRILYAARCREDQFDEQHHAALRLFNGFYEGEPELVIDLFGATLLIYDYAQHPDVLQSLIDQLVPALLEEFPWIQAVLLKRRESKDEDQRKGIFLFGSKADHWIHELDVRYALDLRMNQDASFYLDTRPLRAWLRYRMNGKSVLNTFAYTGSLGVAATAGGADPVIQTDLSKKFLNVAKTSCTLNGFSIDRSRFISGDFFKVVQRLKREEQLFDCVILDPPFFSVTDAGTVDQLNNSHRLINKVRPLVKDQGWLVAINNALFLSGEEYYHLLRELTQDGYLQIETLLPIPPDITGYPETITNAPPVSPEPFNHPTKIAILKVSRK